VTISVLLADDHKIFREGLKALLEQEQDISIVADTSDGENAVALATSLLPDVVILDINMPHVNGIEAARRIVASARDTKIIILSMHLDSDYVSEALRAGAKGFLAKNCSSRELVAAIHHVVAGGAHLSPSISSVIVGLISETKTCGPTLAPGKSQGKLSKRETQVLQLLAEGNCTKEIASQLDISSKTVETYRANLMKKLEITSVAGLVKHAIREGIIILS
jgi:DNA-binding NarL/FixJ family response regulator